MARHPIVDIDYLLMKRANEMTATVEQVRLRRHERERDPWDVRRPRQPQQPQKAKGGKR